MSKEKNIPYRIVCFGPGPRFKGGIANFTTELVRAFDALDNVEVHLVSWVQQYPSIIPRNFEDTSSKKDFLKETSVKIHYITDYNRPSTWRKTADLILGLKPDKLILQWAISLQGLPMAAIVKRVKRRSDVEIIFDVHNVLQKETSFLDKPWTKRALRLADTYIVHSLETYHELREYFPDRSLTLSHDGKRTTEGSTVLKLYHPIYQLFEIDPSLDIESVKEELGLRQYVFLFFGFIRKYKGLHNLIRAFAPIAKERDDVSLLICGESFWHKGKKSVSARLKKYVFSSAKSILLRKSSNDDDYDPLSLIEELNLGDTAVVINEFIPNEDVNKYFQAADAVVLFYDYATPSGIESISYNFKKPILATRVGPFEETIEDGKSGYLAEAGSIESMTDAIRRYIERPLHAVDVEDKTKEMTWKRYVHTIMAG